MKKMISALSVLALLAILLSAFTACGENKSQVQSICNLSAPDENGEQRAVAVWDCDVKIVKGISKVLSSVKWQEGSKNAVCVYQFELYDASVVHYSPDDALLIDITNNRYAELTQNEAKKLNENLISE